MSAQLWTLYKTLVAKQTPVVVKTTLVVIKITSVVGNFCSGQNDPRSCLKQPKWRSIWLRSLLWWWSKVDSKQPRCWSKRLPADLQGGGQQDITEEAETRAGWVCTHCTPQGERTVPVASWALALPDKDSQGSHTGSPELVPMQVNSVYIKDSTRTATAARLVCKELLSRPKGVL